MRRPGTASWSLGVVVGDGASHQALYVRDTLGLSPDIELNPPPALDGVPDRSDVLTTRERDRASAQWGPWWRAALEVCAPVHRPGAGHARRVGAPRDVTAMVGTPELRKAVVTLARGAREWAGRIGYPEERAGSWEQTSDVAGEVARRQGVTLATLRGTIQVLAVEDVWWRLVSPGYVVCSVAARQDDDVAAEILRTTFTSGLPG